MDNLIDNTSGTPLNSNTVPSNDLEKAIVIPVIEEHISIAKTVVESGKVQVSKRVHEVTESVEIPVINEEVDVNRVEINQYVETAPPAVRQEGNKTIIPILKEVLVVEKKLLLVEEVHITRKQVKTTTTKQETLRKEEVIVNRTKTDLNQNSSI